MSSHPTLITARARRVFLSLPLALGAVIALSASTGGSALAGTGQSVAAGQAAAPFASHLAAGHSSTPSAAGTWKMLPAALATSKPFQIASVWTGRQMIIHGLFGIFPTRGRFTLTYRAATRTWARVAAGPAWTAIESDDIAAWTGSRMLVFGLTHGAYDPAANHWTAISGANGPTRLDNIVDYYRTTAPVYAEAFATLKRTP
jgi:hypothetical protein